MDRIDFEAHVEDVKRRAHGQWSRILAFLGVDQKVLNRRNQPCPLCGGKDRFQFTDKFGEGNYFCRKCGPGGGFKLLQGIRGWDFVTALREVEACVGGGGQTGTHGNRSPSPGRMKALAKKIWEEAKPVAVGDDVDRYLRNRGLVLAQYPRALRCHPALGYYEKTESGRARKMAQYGAMVACVQGPDGHAVSLHRTYLHDGKKALGSESRKMLSTGIDRAAIRLFEPAELLAIAEGIETALAVHLATGKAVWAAMSAGNLEKLWIPESVKRVDIYADNDADAGYEGQAAAYALARRLKRDDRKDECRVEVFVPKVAGTDWADVWLSRQSHARHAA